MTKDGMAFILTAITLIREVRNLFAELLEVPELYEIGSSQKQFLQLAVKMCDILTTALEKI